MGCKLRVSFALLFSAPSFLFAADELIFAIDIIRHGDRTPIISLATLNYQWKEGLGQLTAEGMQQEYQMGQEFRKRYIEEEQLLPAHYEYGTMYVRSTYFDRTLMSAESLLMGLYPPGTGPNTQTSSQSGLPYGIQPIPIFSAPTQYDDMIIQQVEDLEFSRLMSEYVYSTKQWQQKDNELKDNYSRWSQLTGLQITSLDDLQLLGDTLYIHQLHHVPIPEGLGEKEVQTIIDASNFAFMAEFKPKQIAYAYSTKLMTNIAHYLNNGSQKQNKLKYVLLSAHDSTIASALSFLGAPLEQSPPYASDLNFSLYDAGGNYFKLKVTYNGKPIFIPKCDGYSCELQQFIQLVESAKRDHG